MERQTQQENLARKARVRALWQYLDHEKRSVTRTQLDQFVKLDTTWHGPAPVGVLRGSAAWLMGFFLPLHQAFSGLERHVHIFMGGESDGRVDGGAGGGADGGGWVCGTGLLTGTFEQDYLGIPANGETVQIRWSEFFRFDGTDIVEAYYLIDLVDLAEQAGVPILPPPRGLPGVYPPPLTGDGELDAAQPDDETAQSMTLIRQFLFEGLNQFDQNDLKSMGVADFFAPDVKWYGPGGIGACNDLAEFEGLHQRPWLVAFPDRQIQDLDSLFAEGCYVASSGWTSVIAHQTGPYLDLAPTGRQVKFNGIDFWRREGGVFVENWVFVDMIHLFAQLGVDLLARLPHRGETGAG